MRWEKVQIKYDGILHSYDLKDIKLSEQSDTTDTTDTTDTQSDVTDEQLKQALSLKLDTDLSDFCVNRTEETQSILKVQPNATLTKK